MKEAYPAFLKEHKNKMLVYVPDLNAYTEGRDFYDAISMGRDAICMALITMEDMEVDLPAASREEKKLRKNKGLKVDDFDFGTGTLTYIDVDTEDYRRRTGQKTVRKNCTIPSWLNEESEHAGINFSQILQEALLKKLGHE